MKLAVTIVTLYGLVSLIGGLIGYLKAKSGASLVAGTVSGAILLGCAFGLAHGSRAAAAGSVVVALLLGGRFFGTWRKRHRVMPDLVMIVGSLVTLLSVGCQIGILAYPVNFFAPPSSNQIEQRRALP